MKKSELATLIQERVQGIPAANGAYISVTRTTLRDVLSREILERICDAAAEVALSLGKEPEQMRKELERAYRCITGFSTARRKGEILDDTAFAYHSPTIGAARRFVKEGALDGSDYFTGKKIDVLHAALDL